MTVLWGGGCRDQTAAQAAGLRRAQRRICVMLAFRFMELQRDRRDAIVDVRESLPYPARQGYSRPVATRRQA